MDPPLSALGALRNTPLRIALPRLPRLTRHHRIYVIFACLLCMNECLSSVFVRVFLCRGIQKVSNSKEAVISQFGTGRIAASKSHLRQLHGRLAEDTTGPHDG